MIKESHSFRLLPFFLTSSDDHETLPEVRNPEFLRLPFLPSRSAQQLCAGKFFKFYFYAILCRMGGEVLLPAK
jgi:hypothetical protein